jgi:hypothetical protein
MEKKIRKNQKARPDPKPRRKNTIEIKRLSMTPSGIKNATLFLGWVF